jgi:hypothetical protein
MQTYTHTARNTRIMNLFLFFQNKENSLKMTLKCSIHLFSFLELSVRIVYSAPMFSLCGLTAVLRSSIC